MSTHAEISALRAQVADLAAENSRLREMNALLLENRALRGAVAPTPVVVPPVPLDAPTPAFRAKCSEYGRLYKDCRAAYEKLSRSARTGARFPRYVQCETDTDTEKAMCRLREFARGLNLAPGESDDFTPVRRRRRRGGRGRTRGADGSPAPPADEPADEPPAPVADEPSTPPPEIGSNTEFPALKPARKAARKAAHTAVAAPSRPDTPARSPADTEPAAPVEISAGKVSADPMKAMVSGLPEGASWADVVEQ